ncbi:SPOR domain-containing protein [Aquimarina megaterium]|uniref:SPOR domain-containing protein n=1 Tax=Aquimarina megaterium TaxID=1443666 RepID=UPI00046EA5EE|nr:SPOR domain-containing protein [Aquimarina megaterium]
MPFITDEELQGFKDQIEKAEESKRAVDYARDKAVKDEKENSRKFKIATIILGIIALLGVAGTVYFMNFNTPENMVTKKKHTSEVTTRDTKIAELTETVKNLSMNQELNANNSTGVGNGRSLQDELVYAVQIGAFESIDLSMYSENFVNFRQIKSGGFNKYALGNFETLNEAKKFRRELVRLGFRNAFIASYQNGERLQIEEAW